MTIKNDKVIQKLNTSVLLLKIGIVLMTVVAIYGIVSQQYSIILPASIGIIATIIALKILISTKKDYENALKQTFDNFTANPDEQQVKR